MITIKEMCVVEDMSKVGYIGYMQSTIPPKILGWVSDNTLCKNERNMPILNVGPMLIATAMTNVVNDIDKVSMEKHEIPILISSLAIKQDDKTWNLYSNVVIMFEAKYDKDKDNNVTRTVNMKIMTKSNDVKTGLNLFDLFSAFDGSVM